MTTSALAPSTLSAATPAVATPASGTSLHSLAGNFDDFLKLLMTQLKNQDPTSPLDTNQFTSQLVQFASVEQQINTNSSLTKLIQATQGSNLLQSSSLVGQKVEVASDQVPLQDGEATIRFQATTSEPVSVGIYSAAGTKLHEATVTSAPGTNTVAWDGKDMNGRAVADGSYRVVAVHADGSAVPFSVLGTATGVERNADATKVKLGDLKVDLSAVQSLGDHLP